MEGEVEALWAAYAAQSCQETLAGLVEHYAPLAVFLAKRALAKAPAWQDRDDMMTFANFGLLDAIEKFDPTKGAKFETYATRRINGSIVDWQRRMDPLTRPVRKKVNELRAAQNALEATLERVPTRAELAEHMGIDEEDVLERVMAQQSVAGSIDAMVEAGTAIMEAKVGLAADEIEVDDELDKAHAFLVSRLARLQPQERTFMLLYYVDGLTLREISKMVGEHEVLSGRMKSRALQALLTA